jgi:aerobic carbon-monoxide dehydrogenase medium subunit
VNVPRFTHLQPADLREASLLLARYGADAKILAGGTDVLVKMKHRRMTPRYLVNIKGIAGLDYLAYEPGAGLRIGPLATIESVKQSVMVRKRYPALHQAAAYMATVAIRNRATLVGNICNGSPSAETAPVLVVLGAELRLLGPDGERTVAVEDFFVGPGEIALAPGELVSEIWVPETPAGAAAAYEKHSLRRMDVALVGVAALVVPADGSASATGRGGAKRGTVPAGLRGGADGSAAPAVADVKIALSAVAPTPMRSRAAEAVLRGKIPTADLIAEAARVAAGESQPITDIRASADLRRVWVQVLTEQVLRQACRAAKMGVL